MEEQWSLEKLGGHKYRLHYKWDGTSEMLDWMMENGYQATSGGGMNYQLDFEEDDDHFNFGASLSECLQELVGNHRFSVEFFHSLARNNNDVDFEKQLAETTSPTDMLLSSIDIMGEEEFLYQIAKNYSKSLVEQFHRKRQELDESGFIDWLKEAVEPKPIENKEDCLRYYTVRRNIFENICFLNEYFDSWNQVNESFEDYQNWLKINEIPMKNPGEIFNYCYLHPDDLNAKRYALYYWFGDVPCACHLFSMLNDQDVSIGVKTLIQNTLIDYGKGDVEFAQQLQVLYDQYRTINRGREINFVQQVFLNEAFVFPEANVKKHLSEDIVDSDRTSFIDIVNPYYSNPEALTKLFKYLVENNYIKPNDLDTAIYRFTGKRKPMALVERIGWGGPDKDLFYIFKKFYGGKYEKIETFFNVVIDEKLKNNGQHSAYADRSKLKQQFIEFYSAKLA